MGKGLAFSSWMKPWEQPDIVKYRNLIQKKPAKSAEIKEEKLASNRKPIVEFAPLHLPYERRMQTLAALIWISIFLVAGPGGIPLVLYIYFYTNWWILSILYVLWIYYDRNTCNTGGRNVFSARNWQLWCYYRDYFPIKLVKTTDLDPKKNYLFGSHPHGILCSGAFACFGTDALNVKQVFPGISTHVLTLQCNFWLPIFREIGVALGMCSVTKESINYLLSYAGGGQAAVLIPGGASESLESHPGTYVVQLKKRKGFIKLALQNGAMLVPVFSFGETDIYEQLDNPEGSTLRKVQNKLQKMISFAPILFFGRGVFQYSFGVLPKRMPIVTVVGAPIQAKAVRQPSQEDIDSLHEQYVQALTQLFHDHRDEYAPNAEIRIV